MNGPTTGGRPKVPFINIHQVNVPLVRIGIVQSQRLGFDVQVLFTIVDFEFLKIGVAVENLFVAMVHL